MNKKHKAVLLGTMITLALQTGSAYAEEVPEEVYKDYVEFGTDKETEEKNKGTATISLDGSDNKDKIFTFEKGATIDGSKLLVDSWNEREKDNAAIINTHDLDKKLIINVGSEKESENNYNFNVIGKTEKELNLNNYSTNIYNEGSISLNTKNTDINLKINSNSKEDKGRSFHITTVGESDLIIDGNNNSNLYLSGTINQSSIQIDDDSSVEIKNLNNFIITDSLKDTSSSAISLHPVFIGENPSLKIENVKNFIINPDADMTEKVDGVYLGGGIYAHSGQVNIDVDEFRIGDEITSFDNEEKIKLGTGITVNSADVNISVKNDLNINSVSTGIKFWYVYDKYKPILNLSANSLKIKAVDHDIEEQSQFTSNLYNSNGTAFYLTGYTGNEEGTTPTITTTNEMILYGDNNGILSVHPRINIDMKSINKSIYVIGKKEHGIFKNDNDSTLKIEADQNVNIFGGKYGIRLMDTENNTVYIKTETDDINIISDKEGIRSDMMFNVLDFESPINNETFEANGNLNIYGKEIGINYLMGAGKAEFISHEGNIQINGDKIAFNSNSILQVPDTDEDWENMGYGHVGNKTFEVRSEKGNVIVGDVPETLDDNINNEQGIAFSGRATLNIDGANTVWIGANKEAIDIDKAIVSNIHGKNIIIQSKDGTAINQEGMNSLTLGYDNISDKMTENIAIKGNIGMSLIANKKGTDDIIEEVKDLYPEGADNTIVGDTNKTILNANNVDIIGKDYGIKMSQDATDMRQERDNNIVDFVNRWRNGVLAINAKENIDILATEGTAIDVDGVNKIAINNSYNNKVVGNKTGINLNLSTKIPLNLKEQIKEYKDNSVKAYIRDEYSDIKDPTWNGNLANLLRSELDEEVKEIGQKIGEEYEDFNAFYEDLFKNPIYQENPELVEVINKMNPEGDPLQEYVKATGILEAIGLDVNNLYEYTYGDYIIGTYIYAYVECNSIEECYDKLVSEGKFEGINTNIDVENSFKLTTGVEGVNTIIGGEKALNADGQVNAVISGGSNVISNYVATPLDEDKEVEPTYAVKAQKEANVDITATNGSNIIQSTGTGIYATDENTIVNVKNETENKEKIIQDEANQIVSGEDVAINADNKATVNLTGKNAKNYISGTNSGVISDNQAKVIVEGSSIDIYSSEGTGILAQQTTNINTLDSQENESTTIDLRATDINITGGKYGVKASENSIINIKSEEENGSIKVTSWNKEDTKENETASIYAESTENEDAEINIEAEKGSINLQSYNKTVWASGNGGEINIKGGNVNIGAYSIERDGERQHIAIVAGTNDKETNEKIGKVNVEIVGSKDNNITGDIIGGRSGEVKVENNGEGTLAVTGDILAGNGGAVDISFGNNSFFKGRVDDYQDAGEKAGVENGFYDPHFTNGEVEEKGTVNIDLGEGTVWNVTGQSWITSLDIDRATVDLLDHENSNYAINIGEISGKGRFIVNLDAENLKESQMIYIYGVKEGEEKLHQTVEIRNIDNVDKLLNGDLEKLRIATVNGGEKEIYFTGEDGTKKNKVMLRDTGVKNLAFYITNEEYNLKDKDNEEYNGSELGETKPGDEQVDKAYGDNGYNWFITRNPEYNPDPDPTPDPNPDPNPDPDPTPDPNPDPNPDPDDEVSEAGKTILNMAKANYDQAVYMDTLNERLGEARYIDGDEGMWVRMSHSSVGKEKAYKVTNNLYQIGYDKAHDDEKWKRRMGVGIDYIHGDTGYDNIWGKGETSRKGLEFYDTWISKKDGYYRDYVAKWGHLENEFDFTTKTNLEKVTGEYNNNVYSISGEWGNKYELENNWYFEPQGQLQYAYITGADYKTSQGTDVSVKEMNSLIARIGFRIGKDIGKEERKSTIYLKANVLHEFLGDQDVIASDATTADIGALKQSYDHSGTWYNIGIGISTMLSDNSYAYVDYERSFGNDNENTYKVNGGVRWTL